MAKYINLEDAINVLIAVFNREDEIGVINNILKDLPTIEPCEDAISRADVLDLATKGVLISNSNYDKVCKAINELPSVVVADRPTETMIVDGIETEIDPLSYEVGYTHGQRASRPRGEWVDELIRCADCLHFNDGRNSTCNLTKQRVTGDDYCSKGRVK